MAGKLATVTAFFALMAVMFFDSPGGATAAAFSIVDIVHEMTPGSEGQTAGETGTQPSEQHFRHRIHRAVLAMMTSPTTTTTSSDVAADRNNDNSGDHSDTGDNDSHHHDDDDDNNNNNNNNNGDDDDDRPLTKSSGSHQRSNNNNDNEEVQSASKDSNTPCNNNNNHQVGQHSRVRRWAAPNIDLLKTETSNLQERSACRWTYQKNVDSARQPDTLIEAVCQTTVLDYTSDQCEHVYSYVPVKRLVGGVWTDQWLKMRVGCTLATPVTLPAITND